MNPFIDSTLAEPLQDAAAHWPKGERASGGPSQGRPSRMARLLRRRSRALKSDKARSKPSGVGLKRLAGNAVVLLGLALSGSVPAWAVDVNSATQESLQTIRGIGPKTAQAILDERMRGGAFDSFEDLSERVKGIGAKKVQSLQAAGLKLSAPRMTASPDKPGVSKSVAGR
ncbi:helix-hairpin-helix domain-containing protein [Pusillimonas sp. CC-YST705]|uniref:Helix-hairpin-helix domain-containing protein n=1 Tax=Mesopusillimonas faecipullorum TaxID=2755040 RepID=A0ABS8CDA1_9BURK|nr:helix-hairpin-helix domain-containing protein [Mesopusillimonas faecipullorum]MCB5364001.1 helix-hairpin-helix domain-containing protein [Mesopusillimonas faecipullorum]